MSSEIIPNATLVPPTELFGFSGNILAAIILITGIIIGVVLFAIVGWLKKRAGKTESKLDDIILDAIGTPVAVGVVVIALFLALQVVTLPPSLAWLVEGKVFTAVIIIFGAWVASSLAHDLISVYGSRIAGLTHTELDDRMIALAKIVTKYVIWFIAFLLILSVLEINITPFLAGAGIAGLAVALAAKDILSNFFGGAMIAVDKPFALNDRIRIDQYYGDVIHVGPRSTRIQTPDNQIITIPNAKVVDSFVVNYAMPDPRLKVRVDVGVAYGTDIDRVKDLLAGIAREASGIAPYILSDPKPDIYFAEFGPSSLNFQLFVWCRDFNLVSETKDIINTLIARRFAAEGIEIPFPQMDVHRKS